MYALWGKPMLERAVAALVLGLGAPIFALLALAVLLALGRPILFRQRRAGRHGKPFTLLKFRSMREGAGPDAARPNGLGGWVRAVSYTHLTRPRNRVVVMSVVS